MAHNLSFISWNVNGLCTRFTDLHAHVMSHNVDVLALQEVGVNGISLSLRGYKSFELPADISDNCRGLTTYVKDSIPAVCHSAFKINGTECLCVKITLNNVELFVVNTYVHANSLNIDEFPDVIFAEDTILLGDLNARHFNLGSTGFQNHNGIVLNSFLEGAENVTVLGKGEPTHIKGGRLDFGIIFNMSGVQANLSVISTLLSDHFALSIGLDIEKISFVDNRKRYLLRQEKHKQFIYEIRQWYKEYKKLNVTDENQFLDDLLQVIDSLLCKQRKNDCEKSNVSKPAYYNDKIVKGWNKLLKKCHRSWSKDPANVKLKETMAEVASISTEVRQDVRKEYFENFTRDIRLSKNLGQIWQNVNKIRGCKRKIIAHPNPKSKANELINKWSYASSFESLPSNVQGCLRNLRSKRQKMVNCQVKLTDDSCIPFTRNEMLNAVKKGKSTSPGRDGITYDIINCLISMEDSPLLDLFNLSYKNGRLPYKWKIALMVPVPKGNGDFRPISLTSCLSKTMERMVLNRLLYKVEGLMSSNLYGFMKNRSTTDCVIKCLSASKISCRLFLDLKGAFDKANKDVVLECLVAKGIKGKLLRWLSDYLTGRKGSVYFQGQESDEKCFDLGTPQGGVLSPMLFNILMDRIASYQFSGNAQVIIYADDILIQCETEEDLIKVIEELSELCMSLGLVVNENKTKYQSRNANGLDFWLNGEKLQKVSSYKYLGMHIGFSKTMDQINYVKNICTARLKPLRVLSNFGNGVGIPILRSVYLSTVRSIIDYSAPILSSFSEKDLKPLEILQNEAMRIILGCPRSTRIEIMRMELNIPSITHRVRELTIVSVLRLIRRGDEYLKAIVEKYIHDLPRSLKINAYAMKICKYLMHYDVLDYCITIPSTMTLQPWDNETIDVQIEILDLRKKDYAPYELRSLFLEKISECPISNTIHVYCDGSIIENHAGCGIVIREFFEYGISTETRITRRISDNSSSTTAELYAIFEGLGYCLQKKKSVYFFVDSQSALFALNAKMPVDEDIVLKCRQRITVIKTFECKVLFMWVPSHCGIHLNEVADDLAKQGCNKESIDYECYMNIKRIKSNIVKIRESWDLANARLILDSGSESLKHYDHVTSNTNFAYGKSTARYDSLAMRLRLGYRYVWEYRNDDSIIPCKLCGMNGLHTMFHYIMECSKLAEFRNASFDTMEEMICYMFNYDLIKDIFIKFKKIDIRY